MEDQRKNELAVVIAATVVFGFMNRILSGFRIWY